MHYLTGRSDFTPEKRVELSVFAGSVDLTRGHSGKVVSGELTGGLASLTTKADVLSECRSSGRLGE
jgi:hypothetical protein